MESIYKLTASSISRIVNFKDCIKYGENIIRSCSPCASISCSFA